MDVEQRARELLADEFARSGELVSEYADEVRSGITHPWDRAAIRAIIAALTPPEGHVVVTRNEVGQALAVTRQDDEGRILSVITEFGPPDGYVLVPVDVQKDAERYQWLKRCSREQYLLARGMFGLAEDAIDTVIRDESKETQDGH
ncbi:hypothetical protein [uncultured Stenotrophomonas sp.]|uniref:hypothetical protein n=1 Tax=uncultured Stenotrophomonas sp. TaxID=165438 RepID=UPI00258CEF39|nr:hypothetical protein [uncultured Stenotrophomonas sp.]